MNNLFQAIDRFYYDMTLNELRAMHEGMLYPNVTYNSLLYLNLIAYSENCTASYLAQALCISKSAVTSKVNELIRQGLVEKVRSETDRRVFYLTVRPEIMQEYKRFDRVAEYAAQRMQQAYTAEQIDRFCSMIQSFSQYYREGSARE